MDNKVFKINVELVLPLKDGSIYEAQNILKERISSIEEVNILELEELEEQDFDFIVDEKMTVWNRKYVSITAKSKKEAIELIRKDGLYNNRVYVDSDELDYDSLEEMDPENNNGRATEIWYDENECDLAEHDNEYIKVNGEY